MRISCRNQCRRLVTACLKRWAKGWEFFPELNCAETIEMIHTITGIRVPPMDTVNFDDPKTGETRQLEWSEVSQMLVDEFVINE
eukprot:1016346-Rhodomonas_salina.1